MTNATLNDITAISVTHNTKDLFQAAYESFRKFHPYMQMIIIDGSDRNDLCYSYISSLASNLTTVGVCGYNLGHGRGMDAAIRMCRTRFALIFDSDVIFVKSPVQLMLDMMEEDTYGVGYTEKSGFDGYEYGAQPPHRNQGFVYMLHPSFHWLPIWEYYTLR